MDYLSEDFLDLGNINPIKDCFKYSLSDKNREVFGLFKFINNKYEYLFKPLKNLNTQDNGVFAVNNSEFYSDYLNNDIICMFHTHTSPDPTPSQIDVEISEALGLPSYVISPASKKHYLYYPQSYQPRNLTPRIFIPFFQDCVSFVKDFYQINFNITFNNIKNWSRENKNSNAKLLTEIEKNFFEVEITNIQFGDLIIFKPQLTPLMHLAVLDKNKNCFHHPMGGVPVQELFSRQKHNKVYKIYRYKDL